MADDTKMPDTSKGPSTRRFSRGMIATVVLFLAIGASLLAPTTRVYWLHGLAEAGPQFTRRFAVEQLFRLGPGAASSLVSLALNEQRAAGPPLFEKGRVVAKRELEYGPVLAGLARRAEDAEAWRAPLISALGEGAPLDVAGAALVPWACMRQLPADQDQVDPLLDAVARRWLRSDCEPELLRYCQWLVPGPARAYEQWAPRELEGLKAPRPRSFAGGGPIRAGHLIKSIKAALGERLRLTPGFDAVFRAEAEVVSKNRALMARCVEDLLPLLQLTTTEAGEHEPPEYCLAVRPGPPVELMFDEGGLVLMSEEEGRARWREWARMRLAGKDGESGR